VSVTYSSTRTRPSCSGVPCGADVISWRHHRSELIRIPLSPLPPCMTSILLKFGFCNPVTDSESVARCFAVLRQLQNVRRSVPASVYQTLVVALLLPRLDYGNATFSGLPAYHYSRLQLVMNAAAQSVAGVRRSDHITNTLACFHWLRCPECVQFRLAVLTFRLLHDLAPRYLSDDLPLTSELPFRRRLSSASPARRQTYSTQNNGRPPTGLSPFRKAMEF
jgi:hypothetical protein